MILRRDLALVLSVALALAPVASIQTASAADPTAQELATARELFDEGIRLENQNDWEGALERFRKVAAVKTSPATRYHLGLCLKNTGRLVEALDEFQRAQVEGNTDPNATVVVKSREQEQELKERLPRIVLKLPEGVTEADVTIDDTPVSAALLGTSIPLDPGKHVVAVMAKGRSRFEKRIEVAERGGTTTIEVDLPEAPVIATDEPPPVTTKPASSRGPGPWIVGGVGLAALAGAGVSFALRQSKISEIEKAGCVENEPCATDKAAEAKEGRAYTVVGDVLLGVGAAAVIGAVIWILVTPRAADPNKAAVGTLRLGVGPSPTPLGFGLSATF